MDMLSKMDFNSGRYRTPQHYVKIFRRQHARFLNIQSWTIGFKEQLAMNYIFRQKSTSSHQTYTYNSLVRSEEVWLGSNRGWVHRYRKICMHGLFLKLIRPQQSPGKNTSLSPFRVSSTHSIDTIIPKSC